MAENNTERQSAPIPIEQDLPIPYDNNNNKYERLMALKRGGTRGLCARILRTLSLVAAFTAIFAGIYYYCTDGEYDKAPDAVTKSSDTPSDAVDERPSVSIAPEREPLLVIDESDLGIDIEALRESEAFSGCFVSSSFKVVILHSHSSEYISENISVADAGAAVAGILESAGIDVLLCDDDFDAEGRIGAYERMRKKVIEIAETSEGELLIIDLHSSDAGTPLTFTIGTDRNFGWQENLRCAVTVLDLLETSKAALRLLPVRLGQDSGMLTLNIGICGRDCGDGDARHAVAELANALVSLLY